MPEGLERIACNAQVVIVPIVKKEADREAVSAAVAGLEGALKSAGVRVRVDAGTEKTPGWKFNFWEMKARLNASGCLGRAGC